MRPKSQADFVKTALRLPPELHAQLHASAKESGRTYNAEILARLEQSFAIADSPEKEIHLSRQQFDGLMEEMRKQIAEHLAWSPEAQARVKGAGKKSKP